MSRGEWKRCKWEEPVPQEYIDYLIGLRKDGRLLEYLENNLVEAGGHGDNRKNRNNSVEYTDAPLDHMGFLDKLSSRRLPGDT